MIFKRCISTEYFVEMWVLKIDENVKSFLVTT